MKCLGFDFFLTRALYGQRPGAHFDLYRMEPRWWFLEVGSWTLEVTLPDLWKTVTKVFGA